MTFLQSATLELYPCVGLELRILLPDSEAELAPDTISM